MTFESDDAGDPAVLRRMVAPKVLHLKPSCPVMLLVNLSDTLVNGSLGVVLHNGEHGPVVEFSDAGITMEITPSVFSGRHLNWNFFSYRHTSVFPPMSVDASVDAHAYFYCDCLNYY